jgi:16S rRNA (guanine(527)-N(7))-methyltransferase RsmG
VKQFFGADHSVSRETQARLETYVGLLLRWNRTINLIARREEGWVWQRHIADSLALVPLLPRKFSHGIDLGSGAGFPGLVLAIATNLPFHLVESDRRKAAFLREAIRVAGVPAKVHAARVEQVALSPAPVITARAAAPLALLLRWSERMLAPGGFLILPKGRGVEHELTAASAQWQMRVERFRSPTDSAATILRITRNSRADNAS